ncbi:MAG TPA: MerR family transcriptional regulator [Mycobacteriales bacterium]|nr:MerR family transcriptional regulator [Mycobacteriales bacterium]
MAEDYTVGRVAEIAGVTVRTLHHYDEIGLVRASGRTAAGYRVYELADIERLQQALTYRALGFGLDEIAALIDNPDVDAVGHLLRQRELLVERGGQISAMVAAIDKALEARAMGMQLTPEEQLEVFGTDKVGGEWAEEAEARWGETDAFRESQRRTASYTKADWARLKEEADSGVQGFASAMRDGVGAGSEAGMALAEQHRQFLSRWFYDCDHAMHRSLGESYVADGRFTATFDSVEPGLAAYVRDAIVANATAHGA